MVNKRKGSQQNNSVGNDNGIGRGKDKDKSGKGIVKERKEKQNEWGGNKRKFSEHKTDLERNHERNLKKTKSSPKGRNRYGSNGNNKESRKKEMEMNRFIQRWGEGIALIDKDKEYENLKRLEEMNQEKIRSVEKRKEVTEKEIQVETVLHYEEMNRKGNKEKTERGKENEKDEEKEQTEQNEKGNKGKNIEEGEEIENYTEKGVSEGYTEELSLVSFNSVCESESIAGLEDTIDTYCAIHAADVDSLTESINCTDEEDVEQDEEDNETESADYSDILWEWETQSEYSDSNKKKKNLLSLEIGEIEETEETRETGKTGETKKSGETEDIIETLHFGPEEIDPDSTYAEVLKDVDVNSFYGSTGKLMKLRIRNFLNHECLELSFNCSKNIIVGRNGQGKSAIAQAVAIALGSAGKQAGRDASMRTYIKDYNKDKRNATCGIQLYISNSGKHSFKRNIYGNVIVLERHISVNGSSYAMYGLGQRGEEKMKSQRYRETPGKKTENGSSSSVSKCKQFRKRKKQTKQFINKLYLDKYLNRIHLNVKSPCVYLDQERGKRFFSEISDKDLYTFFMNASGLNAAIEFLRKEEYYMITCVNILKNKKKSIQLFQKNIGEFKRINERIKEHMDLLTIYDDLYKGIIFFESLKKTILSFNLFFKAETRKNISVIKNIKKKMNDLIAENDHLKNDVQRTIQRSSNLFEMYKKGIQKDAKYKKRINCLKKLKLAMHERLKEYIEYVSSFENTKHNRELMEKYLQKYEDQMNSLKDKLKNEKDKINTIDELINKRGSIVYEMEYGMDQKNRALTDLNTQLVDTTQQFKKNEQMRQNRVKEAIHLFRYDIYALRQKVLGICKNEKEQALMNGSSFTKERDHRQDHEKTMNVYFRFAPIGPVAEYIKFQEDLKDRRILSVLEQHFRDFLTTWLVGCYEDLLLLKEVAKEHLNKFNIIVSNSYKQVNRETLLNNIHNIGNKVKGRSIYSFFNLEVMPTPLLFHLYDHFSVTQTFICITSKELRETLDINGCQFIRRIYVIDDMVTVDVKPNGSLYFQPFYEEQYAYPRYFKYAVLTRDALAIVKKKLNGNPDDYASYLEQDTDLDDRNIKNKKEIINDLENEKRKVESEILSMSSKMREYKEEMKSLRNKSSLAKMKTNDLTSELMDLEKIKQKHEKLFTEQLEEELERQIKGAKTIETYMDEIDRYKESLEWKQEDIKHVTHICECIITSHANFLKEKLAKFKLFMKECNLLESDLKKAERDQKMFDDIAENRKKDFLACLNKLHELYCTIHVSHSPLNENLTKIPFLVIKDQFGSKQFVGIDLNNMEEILELRRRRGRQNQHETKKSQRGSGRNKNRKKGVLAKQSTIPLMNQMEIATRDDTKKTDFDMNENPLSVTLMITNVLIDGRNKSAENAYNITVNLPLSILSKSNKQFLLEQKYREEFNESNKEYMPHNKEDLQDIIRLNSNGAFSNNTNTEENEIADLLELEKHIKSELLELVLKDGSFTCNNMDPVNNEESFERFYEDIKQETGFDKFLDYIWKKKQQRKNEVIKLLLHYGHKINDASERTILECVEKLQTEFARQEETLKDELYYYGIIKKFYLMHMENLHLRRKIYVSVLKNTQKKIRKNFKTYLKQLNNYEGNLKFDHEHKTLSVLVSINLNMKKHVYMNLRSLSGGEKSTIQMALLAAFSMFEKSPLHIYDELDVYMDEFTRVKNLKMFFDFIKSYKNKQYFFITPHSEITEIFIREVQEDKAKILNLSNIV